MVSVLRRLVRKSLLTGLLFGVMVAATAAPQIAQAAWPYCLTGCTANDVNVLGIYLRNITRAGNTMTGEVWMDFEVTAADRYCIVIATTLDTTGDCTGGTTYYQQLGDLPKKSQGQPPYSYHVGVATWPAGSAQWACRGYAQWIQQDMPPGADCPTDCGTYTDPSTNSKCWGGGLSWPFLIVPSVSVNSAVICPSGSAVITATTNAIAPTYTWTVPVGATNPGNVASFTASTPGTYTVRVTDMGTGLPGYPRTSWNENSGTVTQVVAPDCSITAPSGVCAGQVGYTASVPDAGAGASYSWSITGGQITAGGTTRQVTWTAGSASTAHLSVTVTAGPGCSSSCYRDVTVYPLPGTPTAANNGPVCVGRPLMLTGGPAGMASYSWTGPNGFTSNLQSPTVSSSATPAMAGTYSLTVTNSSGCTSGAPATTTVVVNALPTPTAANSGPVCVGQPLALTGGPSGMSSYSWTGPNGFTSNLESPTVSSSATLAMAGTYSLTVTNSSGCASSAPAVTAVVVNALPTPTATNGGPVCVGQPLVLTGGPSGMSSYSWAGPNGFTSNLQNPTVSSSATLAMAGTYSLTVTNSNGCTSSVPATTTVVVNALPTPTATNGGPVCVGQPLVLTGGPSGMSSYSWTGPNGFTSNLESPTVSSSATPAMAGTYSLTVTNSSGCTSSAPATTAVVVNSLPNCTITAPDAVYAGTTGNAASVADAGPGATYSWAIVGGAITAGWNTRTLAWTAGTADTALLTATVTNASGCSTTCSKNVAVVARADLRLTKVADSATVVAGTNLTYTISLWNDGPSTATGVTVTDALPIGVSLVSYATSQGTLSGNVWTVGTLPYAGSAALTLVVYVSPDATGVLINTACASGNEDDPDNSDNCDTTTTTVTPRTDLRVTKTDSPDPVVAGQALTYAVVVTNDGPSNATGVSVAETLPAGVSFSSATPSVGTYSSSTHVWTVGNLAVGASATLTLVVNVGPGTTGTLTNTACATGIETDPNSTNNCGTTTTTSLVPGLAIEKTGPASVSVGGVIAYTVSVTNTGAATLHNVTVSDPKLGFSDTLATLGVGLTATYSLTYGPVTESDLPGPIQNIATADSDETTSVSDDHSVAITTSPAISVDKTAPAGPYQAGDTIVYSFLVTNGGNVTLHGISISDPLVGLSAISGYATTLVPGASTTGTATYSVTQADVDRGSIVNTATVQGTPPVGGPVGGTDTNTVPLGQTPALAITKTGDAGPVTVGDVVHYAVAVSNVGNVTLHNVTVSDPKLGFSDTLATLGVGLTATYSLTYGPVSESDLPGPIVNAATADSDETTSVSDDHSVAITTSPAISVDKTAPAGPYQAGDTIVYSFLVTNSGNVTLHGISISDPLVGLSAISGYATTLAPDASTTGTATYSVTQADVDRGSIVNTATVQGTPPVGTPVGDTDTNIVPFGQTPALAITKTGDAGPVTIGDVVHYTVAVSNVGNVTLHNVTVSDAKLGFSDTLATLGVGLTATYNLTYGPVSESDLPGPIVNTATADSDETSPVSDGHSVAITTNPAIAVVKDANKASVTTAGETIAYTFTVTNSGNVTLSGITLVDTKTDTAPTYPAYVGGDTNSNGKLDLSETWTYTSIDTVTQAELDLGAAIVDVATADSTESQPATDTATVYVSQSPALAITKTGDAGPVTIGDTVHYTVAVSNVGNVTLHNVTVSDAKLGFLDTSLTTLGVGLTATYHLTYGPVTESDLPGPIQNIATADSDETTSVSDDHSVAITTSPAISVDKTAPAGPYQAGDTIVYSFLVTNSGNVTLHGISISDPLVGLSAISGYATTLAPGASTTGTATYSVTQADVDRGSIVNTATVQGTPPVGTPVGGTDTHTVPFTQSPALQLVKSGDLGPVTIGDVVHYTIAVSNVGNVTLHNVTVSDAKLGFSDTLATLGVGLTATYTLTYGPVTETDLPGPIINTATADSDETTSVNDDHSVDVLQFIDLGLTETVDVANPNVGDVVTLTLILTNAAGTADATGVSVQHLLGAGFQFLSSSTLRGSYDGASGLWTVGSLGTGETVRLEILATVLAHGPFTSSAEVEAADQQDADSTPANAALLHEDDDDGVAVAPPTADLSIEKTVSDATPAVGDAVDFILALTNLGPDVATGVVVTDLLPGGLTLLTDDGSGAYNSATGEWNVGSLSVGATATLRLTVRIDQGTLGLTIENVAIAVPGREVDPNLSNNRAVATVHMPAADLQLRKTVSNANPSEGDMITFAVELTNLGPDAALGIEVADLLPAGLTYSSHSGSGGYDPFLGVWSIGALAGPNRSATLRISATVDAGTAGSEILNVADVTSSDLPDPDPTNNHAEAGIVVAGGGGGGGGTDECTGRVIINEVAWAGTAADAQGQWIELRNVGTSPVDLTGWTLRWRKKVPVAVEDYVWKEVRLSGVLQGAAESACELALVTPVADIQFTKRDIDGMSWLVVAEPRQNDESYLLLERKSDKTIRNIDADVVYDVAQPYALGLSPEGDVMQLLDSTGSVVDTANASEPEENGWPAGDSATFATMERTDPRGADARDNWHTNVGVVTRGEDADGTPLVATARSLNSEPLDEWTVFARALQPTPATAGTQFSIALDLTQSARLDTGWPWIRVTEPALDAAGGGASIPAPSTYTFAGRVEEGRYIVDIDTTGMAPGEHLVWIVFAEGKAVLVPITVLP